MIRLLRHSKFTKVLWGLMGLYMLNISVDTADPNPEHIPEDLTFNDQESIIEIIVEQVLGFENAIQEYDDHDTEDHNKKKDVKVDYLVFTAKTNNTTTLQLLKTHNRYPNYSARLTQGFKEIDSPPPKI
ncbi:hypothetical protein AB9K24_09835 [Meridianimaribacter flavus]